MAEHESEKQEFNVHKEGSERRATVREAVRLHLGQNDYPEVFAIIDDYAKQEYMLVVGGLAGPKQQAVAEVLCYNPNSSRWCKFPPLHTTRAYPAVVVIPNKLTAGSKVETMKTITVFGGRTTGAYEHFFLATEQYDSLNNSWTEESVNRNKYTGFQQAALFVGATDESDSAKYLVIGNEEHYDCNNNVDVYSFATEIWISSISSRSDSSFTTNASCWQAVFPRLVFSPADVLAKRWRLPLVTTVRDKLYLMESDRSMIAYNQPLPLHCLDMKNQHWEEKVAPCPMPRAEGAMIALDDYIYVIGGTKYMCSGTHECDKVICTDLAYYCNVLCRTQICHRYSTVANTWECVAPLPTINFDPCGAAVEGHIYVCRNDQHHGELDLWRYSPLSNTWSNVPASIPEGPPCLGLCCATAVTIVV